MTSTPQNGTPGNGGWNEGPASNPFRLVEEMLPQKAKSAVRTRYGILGVAAVLLGGALLFWPGRTLSVAAILIGIYFIVSGVIRIVSALVELGLPAGWRVLDILVGVLLSVGGVIMLKNTTLSATTLAVLVTMTVGIGWIMEGVIALTESWKVPNSGWAVAYAVLSIIAGVVVLVFPLSATAMMIIFAAVALLVTGVVAVVRAFSFGRSR
nr:DUF308 domain-containing protein [uncultured Bifidobacterium sp.]